MNDRDFVGELIGLLNKYGWDRRMNTPDLLLAEHLYKTLKSLDTVMRRRVLWRVTDIKEKQDDKV